MAAAVPEAAAAVAAEPASPKSVDDYLAAILADGAAEPAAPEPAEEAAPAPAEKETDALSLEELESDFYKSPQAGNEATKKIDKFYTLYRKNEEFQRLLDEEYNKLKAAGGPAPEPAIPLDEPVSNKKIEDATIYQDFDLEKEAAKLREEQAKAEAEAGAVAEAAEAASEEASGLAADAVPAAAAAATAVAAVAAAADKSEEPEEEVVEKGSGCLTILAVVIALLLIVLLGIILVLNFMPDSAIAFKIDSIIENITSHFTAVDVMGREILL